MYTVGVGNVSETCGNYVLLLLSLVLLLLLLLFLSFDCFSLFISLFFFIVVVFGRFVHFQQQGNGTDLQSCALF